MTREHRTVHFLYRKSLKVNDGQVRCDGVEHMDAGQDIGGCVSPVQKAYHSDENIIPFKLRGSQQVSVGIEGGHNQEQCHTGIEEYNIFVKVSRSLKNSQMKTAAM